jgi:hypothetical protein
VRVLPVIATSLGCGAAITTALARYIDTYAASAGFWGHDPVGIAWAASSGMGGFLAVLYAAFAFLLLTTGTLLDLAAARRRLEESAENDRWPEGEWQRAFDGTAFEAIAGQFTSYELGIAPLSLLRILRAEIWRVYAKRFITTQTVTIILVVGAVILDRFIESPLPPPFTLGVPFQTSTIVLLLVVAVMTWLLMDDGISKLAMAVTRLSAGREWPEESVASRALAFGADEPVAATVGGAVQAIEPLLASINKLVGELSGRMTPTEAQTALGTRLETSLKSFESALRDGAIQQRAAIEHLSPPPAAAPDLAPLETTLKAIETALREGAERQQAVIDRLAAEPATKEPGRRGERGKETDAEFRKLGEAINLLAMAVDKLAQAEPRAAAPAPAPVAEVRPPAPPRRRENGEGRGEEFAAALRDMNAGLDKHPPGAASAEPNRPGASALTNELQDLLQEMSNYDATTGGSTKRPPS